MREHLVDVLILTPPLIYIGGAMASSAPRLGPFLLELTLASNEELTRGRERTRGADLWSADRKRWPNCLKLGLEAASWAPIDAH